MEQFQKYDISFVVESKLSCGGEVLITKCGNRMAIQEKKIFFGGININNPLFYIDDFRPYFTSVIYYNLVLLRNVFMIHSASYSMNGKGYMIIGDSGCGKSSLTLANILSGIKYDINIMFENHSSCFISTIDSILDFKQMERFHNNVYLNWDPNNSYQVSRKKYAGEYKEICDIVKNIHVKDTIYKGDTEIRVPLGKGEVGWEQIFADLIKGEYRGKYTIETHYV